ncbi:LOW QUALITY PROTEIN: centrosomal protein of 126 kDa [Sceloporus undulatus]|uniref:LOW QUALITY PROTEIN: centrosomal protein of 126 kDa n=1 Tax=Sceloporus undulatus TaxID=8520 RepID=UPI001C4A7F1F|nr:LOW QUALITY PROTEIN: centrosomal protein of 126 kDa [Sceloporus undulatus]
MELGGGSSNNNSSSSSSGGPYSSSAREQQQGWKGSAGDGGGDDDGEGATPGPGPGWRKGRSLAAFLPSSNTKVLLERDLSKERHELLKGQRLYRSQARKHSIETNKRRRALEEKWKEDEEKEQKFREQILLQRKLKHQEATERFQRAHLPASQRKRGGGVQRKTELQLDEALQKIQTTGLLSSKVIGRTADTPSSATRNDTFNWKQSSAKTGCDRIMQENRTANLNSDQLLFQQNLDEMQQQLKEQHFSNLQDFHQEVNEIIHSESVCSLDSLEAGEPNESCTTPSETSSLSAQLDFSVHSSQGSQTRHKSFSSKSDIVFSKNQHVNNWLINLNTSNIQTTSPFRDILIKHNIVPSGDDPCSPDWKSSTPNVSGEREAERCASDNNLNFAQSKRESKSFLLKCPSSETVSTESPKVTETPVLKSNKAWAIPDPPPAVSVQEKTSELPQNNRGSCSQHAVNTSSLVFPATDWGVKAPKDNSFFLNCMQKGKDAHAARCTEDIDYLMGAKDEENVEHVNAQSTLFEETSKDGSDQPKCDGEEKVNEYILSLPQGELMTNLSELDQQKKVKASEGKGVTFPKSILKKESKYEPGYFRAVVVNRGVKFGSQSVSAARDSIELAKLKGKNTDIQKNSKKLRWFDEINRVVEANDDEKCSEQSITEIPQPQSQSLGSQIKPTASRTNLRSIPSFMLNSVFQENHQEYSQTSAKPTTVGGLDRDNVIQNNFALGGYHIAKQAWMAPRGEEVIPVLHNCDPKNQKNNPRRGRTKPTKRPKSAKAPSSTINKNRKGTLIRPQSASEATKIMKTQGKIMVPHPPGRPIPGKRPDESPADGVYQSVNLCKPQLDNENSHFLSGKSLLSEGQDVVRNAAEDTLPSTNASHSHAATMRPSYSVLTYEPLTKAKCITKTAQSIARSNSFPRRNPVYSENGLCPERTPTDEEIAVLWQGMHRALAQKDGTAGNSQHCVTVCNHSSNSEVQSTRPNVSHITIDGGTLMGNIKPGARSNTIFASQPSTSVAFARRKQVNENIEIKRKALLEQRRQMAALAGRKPAGVGQNMAQVVKQVQSQCAYDPVQTVSGVSNSDGVSDSTAEFLLAENLVNLSATESEILTNLDAIQPHKQTAVLNRPPRQGMSALSFEEHKVLQSLDRINQRLQNVHETINKIPSSTSIMQTVSPLIVSPSYMDLIHPMQRYRSVTDATYNVMQKKY